MGTRDKLAIERSRLANERTLLSFMRTSIVFFATGITMFKLFFEDQILTAIGVILTITSFAMIGFGFYFYTQTKKHLEIKNFLPVRKTSHSKS